MKLLIRIAYKAVVVAALFAGLHTAYADEAAQEQRFLAAVFSDHMVLQRNMTVPVWGFGKPGSGVSVVLTDQQGTTVTSAAAKANKAGKWTVNLAPQNAGGPFELHASGGEQATVCKDVLFGDVWVCSGQSNMDMMVKNSKNADQEIANADYPSIRYFNVPWRQNPSPLKDLGKNDGWKLCTPRTAGTFSAAAYFFGRDIHQQTSVPIGLLKTALGGTPAESWMSEEALRAFPEFNEVMKGVKLEAADPAKAKADFERKTVDWVVKMREMDSGFKKTRETTDPVSAADGWTFAAAKLDTRNWLTLEQPRKWEETEIGEYNGSLWLRKTVNIPAQCAGKETTLSLGAIDDDDWTWFNGERVGTTDGASKLRSYRVRGDLVKAGENTIAVRVWDGGGGGGFNSGPDAMFVQCEGEETSITLAGVWHAHKGVDLRKIPARPVPPGTGTRPAVLFNAMVHPIIPYAMTGVIWYQGESNASRADQYRKLFPAMIRNWRELWDREFPFFYVQLAGFMARPEKPGDDAWAELREAQLMTLKLPKTGMASAVDVGEAFDIHPKNKQAVGERLAICARALVYGQKIEFMGPIMREFKVNKGTVRIKFDHAKSGLMSKGDKLEGFAVAGQDRKFVWAEAQIEGDAVLVSSSAVAQPAAVRYGWESNPRGNLYNKENLPASPFRTDNWPGITAPAK